MKLFKLLSIALIFFSTTLVAQVTVGSMVVGQGVTSPKDWVDYNGAVGGIYVDVNTSACGFTQTPHYLVTLESLTNSGYHWYISGVPSIYSATPTGFRVYIRWTDIPSDDPTIGSLNFPNPLRASTALNRNWVIRWTAISTTDCAACNKSTQSPISKQSNSSPFGEAIQSSNFEKKNEKEVTIFPNPSNTRITISSSDNILKTEVYNLNGQLLKTTKKKVINIKGFLSGEYIVKAYFDNNEIITKKIIKQ